MFPAYRKMVASNHAIIVHQESDQESLNEPNEKADEHKEEGPQHEYDEAGLGILILHRDGERQCRVHVVENRDGGHSRDCRRPWFNGDCEGSHFVRSMVWTKGGR